MSVELISVLIAVLAVGVTLAGVILTSSRGLRQDMRRLDERISGLESHIGELRERMTHLDWFEWCPCFVWGTWENKPWSINAADWFPLQKLGNYALD